MPTDPVLVAQIRSRMEHRDLDELNRLPSNKRRYRLRNAPEPRLRFAPRTSTTSDPQEITDSWIGQDIESTNVMVLPLAVTLLQGCSCNRHSVTIGSQ
jgi:hypothetical protein